MNQRDQAQDETGSWDNLMPTIWSFLTSANTILMENALKILGTLFIYCGSEFSQHQNDLFPVLKQTLAHENIKVKGRAIEAISNYLGTISSKKTQVFVEFIPLILEALLLIVNKDEELVGSMIKLLIYD